MFLTLLLLVLGPPQTTQSVEAIRLTPSVTHQFELGKNGVKGSKLEKFAWSPDRHELYLMTYEPNTDATIKQAFHYVMQVASGAIKSVDAAPKWVDAYWSWKSDRSAPGDPSLEIAVSQERKRAETGVATPMGGEMARGGVSDTTGGVSSGVAVDASRGMQFQNVYTLTLKGTTIGEWIDHRIQPGLTFSWGPKNSGLIAFVEKSGQLVIMDRAGRKQKVEGTKGVVLPAWTEDGTHMAYLETRGKNKYEVIIAEVKGGK